MRIATVFPWLLTDNVRHGGAIYALNTLRQLSDNGHELYLVNMSERAMALDDWQAQTTELRGLCRSVDCLSQPPQLHASNRLTRQLLAPLPTHSQQTLSRRFNNPDVGSRLGEIIRTHVPDVVLLHYLDSGLFIPPQASNPATSARPRFILHDYECASHRVQIAMRNAKGLAMRLRLRMLLFSELQHERKLYRRADSVLLFSEEERKHVTMHHDLSSVHVVQPVIRVSDFSPTHHGSLLESIVFTGSFYHQPNVDAAYWFARYVMPHIRSTVPSARLTIVCTEHSESVLPLQSDSIDVVLASGSVAPWLAGASVIVSPVVSGSGVRLKNLAAFAAGRALVTTTLGSQGLFEPPGKSYLVADEPKSFAHQVTRLLTQPTFRHSIEHAARSLAERHFDVSVGTRHLEQILQQVSTHGEGQSR